jgi:hypothetical protein
VSNSIFVAQETFNLSHVIHDFLVSLTGFDNTLVRPMYQPNPPTVPPFGTDWIAFNISQTEMNGSSYQVLNASDVFKMQRQLKYNVVIAIYGANASVTASTIRSGMELSQNWDSLRVYSIALSKVGSIMRVPELHNQRWLDRYNITLELNHITSETAGIMSIISATENIVIQ